jgi:hypothetical protein
MAGMMGEGFTSKTFYGNTAGTPWKLHLRPVPWMTRLLAGPVAQRQVKTIALDVAAVAEMLCGTGPSARVTIRAHTSKRAVGDFPPRQVGHVSMTSTDDQEPWTPMGVEYGTRAGNYAGRAPLRRAAADVAANTTGIGWSEGKWSQTRGGPR